MQDREEVARYFKELPPQKINQHHGHYRNRVTPCCVGAHLTHILTTENTGYLDGADAWAKLIGGNRAHAILLLRQAGAPHDPFSEEEWPVPPSVVFEAAAMIETLPELRGSDLSHTILVDIDLAGADLSGTNLRFACMQDVNLQGAKLAGADLSGADLRDSNMEEIDLTGAMLIDTSLVRTQMARANLKHANLQRAVLHASDLKEADLYRANLTSATLTEAILTGANLTEAILDESDLTGAILDETELATAIHTRTGNGQIVPITGERESHE